ncbi:ornithine cyclodeaminase [Microbacterium arabinogalactanolyticum]|jgi:ornithine cyclodeaminase|uniref:ornithine cyclodeaminase n=1 Tax=Microbacterium arabinogalactanolyticum TaxID=69365 RepID=UPI002553AA35|nr:ornithine cyclodeaminase [Microbacterium arabinogalactanolyticum]GLC85261.1 ornithine cyclodeaminase [Microbacterium arabinogalactanolyticum]
MVRFVDVPNMRRWLVDTGIERAIEGIAETLVEDFKRWEDFDKTPRVASHSHIGVIELMPASDGRQYGFKYVNGHPSNPARGLQTVTAFGVLADVDSGYPTLWSEMTILTALRTAATSAMVARVLAPEGATTMAMIGTGSQSEFQALAFRALLGIQSLRIWDTDPHAMDVFEANMRPLGFDIVRAASGAEAVQGAQIITTCTADKANATVLTDDMVGPGVHVNAIGGDCPGKTELDARILHRGDIFVEYPPQTRIEGEIQQLDPEYPVIELWRVLRGEAAGRTSAEQITIFDSVGFAIEDFSALRYLDSAIDGTDYFTEVDIIAEPADPKNLFALVAEGASAHSLA